MEYPEIPITQETWGKIIKRGASGHLDSTAKYIDIQSGKKSNQNSGKRKQKSSKSKPKNKNAKTKSSVSKKRKKTVKKQQKSTKKPRVVKAPANFI